MNVGFFIYFSTKINVIMKSIKILSSVVLFILMSNTLLAQGTKAVRVVYDFSFQSDSTNPASIMKDQYALDIFSDHSKFVSFGKIKMDEYMDSLTKSIEQQGGIQNIRSINVNKGALNINSKNIYEVYKMNDGKIKYQQKLMRETYGYEEDMSSLAWNITDSTQKYGQYNCQLAKLNYGGRNWNALFTTEVPINNGPYKFSGLPGLIVKMWDDKNQCVFELAEMKNIENGNSKIPKSELVKKSEFLKLEENAKTQLLSMANSVLNSGNSQGATVIRSIRDQNGNEIKMDDMIRKMSDAEKKNNNRIEIK